MENDTNQIAKDFDEIIKKIANGFVEVGWYEESKYDNNNSVPDVAMKQEFGTDKIPMRPFIRPAIQENGDKWLRIGQQELMKVLQEEGMTVEKALARLGEVVKGDIRKSIRNVENPPLSDATVIMRARKRARYKNKSNEEILESATKGLRKPLIDTGLMLQSLQKRVNGIKDKEEEK